MGSWPLGVTPHKTVDRMDPSRSISDALVEREGPDEVFPGRYAQASVAAVIAGYDPLVTPAPSTVREAARA